MKCNLKFLKKVMTIINCLTLALVVQTANAACLWIFHQPEFPEAAKKFCRVK